MFCIGEQFLCCWWRERRGGGNTPTVSSILQLFIRHSSWVIATKSRFVKQNHKRPAVANSTHVWFTLSHYFLYQTKSTFVVFSFDSQLVKDSPIAMLEHYIFIFSEVKEKSQSDKEKEKEWWSVSQRHTNFKAPSCDIVILYRVLNSQRHLLQTDDHSKSFTEQGVGGRVLLISGCNDVTYSDGRHRALTSNYIFSPPPPLAL